MPPQPMVLGSLTSLHWGIHRKDKDLYIEAKLVANVCAYQRLAGGNCHFYLVTQGLKR